MLSAHTPRAAAKLALILSGAAALSSCDPGRAGPRQSRPVDIRVAAAGLSVVGASTAPAALEITSLRLVIGAASLGRGDQFGCVDCEGEYGDGPQAQKLIEVVPGGAPVLVSTELVGAGRYEQAEISVEQPSAATLAGVTDWPAGATMEVVGRFNSQPFRLPLTIQGSFRETLSTPVEVTSGSAPAAVAITITLPVASWFSSGSATLDPNDAGQRAQIEANARRSFQSDESGRESEGGSESEGAER